VPRVSKRLWARSTACLRARNAPASHCCEVQLEVQLQRELQDARVECRCQTPEGRAIDVVALGAHGEVCMVEGVEHLGAEFEVP
jgi:hypothetical protein